MTLRVLHKKPPQGYCQTPTGNDIQNLLFSCRQFNMMGMIVGEPGTGKSTAAQAYSDNEADVVLCRVTKATGELQPMLVRLCEAMGLANSSNQGKAELYEVVLYSLMRDFAGNGLLILDEAQHLSDDALECIRDLYDETKVGIVLIGNKGLKRWELAKKGKQANSFAQLRGRIGPFMELAAPLDQDVMAICEFHQLKTGFDLVRKIARKEGQLHLVAKVIQVAGELSESDRPITHDDLKKAATVVLSWG